MNERIRELALEARLGPALLLHHWGTVDALTDSEQDELEQIEKFAELIVKECAKVILETPVDYMETDTMHRIRDSIKQHFGVEE